jgi:DNA-binding response OmpR family regulator
MPKTIVVADDEVDALNVLRDILEAQGYRVFAVTDGQAVIDTVQKEKPDVLVVDNSMPELEGREVIRRLREKSDFNSMKILFMSAASAEFDLKAARELGADAFLSKPFDIDQLIDAVQKLV